MNLRPILLCLLLSFTLPSLALAQTDDPTVLSLPGGALSLSDFEQRFAFYVANVAASQNIPLTEETRPLFEQLRPVYLEQLATEQLVLALGRARGLSPDETFVETQLGQIRASFDSEDAYQTALEQAGLGSEARLALYLREAELSNQTLGALQNEAVIPDYQVQLYYDANRASFAEEAESCARHILVETLEEAQALQNELAAGASFEELAQANSLDPGSAQQGGDLGCFPTGVMVASFEEAAFGTPVDTVSAPIESAFGYHLVLPYARREASLRPLAEVEDAIRQGLRQQVVRKVLEGYRDSVGVQTFPELLAQTSEEGEGD